MPSPVSVFGPVSPIELGCVRTQRFCRPFPLGWNHRGQLVIKTGCHAKLNSRTTLNRMDKAGCGVGWSHSKYCGTYEIYTTHPTPRLLCRMTSERSCREALRKIRTTSSSPYDGVTRFSKAHFRHRRRDLGLPQHPTRQHPIPHPVQRLPPILIAAPGGGELLRMRTPSDWTGQNLDTALAPAIRDTLDADLRITGSSGRGFRFDPATHSNLIRPPIPGHPVTLSG